MSAFISLRSILQEKKPDLTSFIQQLETLPLGKQDLNLLLRKAVESKPQPFSQFCAALVKKGASVNFYDSKDNISNLMIASEKGTLSVVESLLRYQDVKLTHTDTRQLHAGFYAIENKSKEDSQSILHHLLQREPALVNLPAGNQNLLAAAIRKGRWELVKILLQAGGDPNWQIPDTGNTSLHDAVKQLKSKMSKAMSQIVRLLLMKGGDTSIKNKQQKTVYDYAEKALPDLRRIEEAVKEYLSTEQQKIVVVERINSQQEVNVITERAYQLFKTYQGESDDEESFLTEADIHTSLTDEIIRFQKDCQADYQAAQRDLKPFLARLQKMVQADGLVVEVYGSFATGLWMRQSNIDIQLTRQDIYDNSISPKDILERVFDQLKRSQGSLRLNLINRNGRMSIRVEIGQGNRTKIINIAVSDRILNGMTAVKYITDQLQQYSQLRPTFLVLKALTCHYKLNDHKSGGIRTYTLFMMLLSCVIKWNKSGLGKLLIDFLFYFSFYYQLYEMKPQQNDCSISLHIMDPLNPAHDLGKHIKAGELQKMFRGAYIACRSNVGSGSRLQMMFDTKKILMS